MTAVNTRGLCMKAISARLGPTGWIIADFTSFAGRMLPEPNFAVSIISIQLVIWFAHRAIILENLNNRFKTNNAKYEATRLGECR